MPDLLSTVQERLNDGLRGDFYPLFCETLGWGKPTGAPRQLVVPAPVSRSVTVSPVASLAGLPVLRIDWPDSRLPTLTQRRAVHRALQKTAAEHLLCYVNQDATRAAFVWARTRKDGRTELRSLPYEPGSPARTTIEQIAKLRFTLDELGLFGEPALTAVFDKLNKAFDVEAVTRRFFDEYENCFASVRDQIRKTLRNEERAHYFTQHLFNRLMFCWFLQKKGWLAGQEDYLLRLLRRAENRTRTGEAACNAYQHYFTFLFFNALCTPEDERHKRQHGDPRVSFEVPFLNGGLFERTPEDEEIERAFRSAKPPVPNSVLHDILENLFARYNFTVEESTPLDIQVALDPELLGAIFERLITKRHETGSYYTPRHIVEYMCKEALVTYLGDVLPTRHQAVEKLVYNHDVSDLSVADANEIVRALDSIYVCDPACGSGAYLVAMLHELVSIYRSLYSEALKDPRSDYELKLRIIERNLYGVDIDPFAVNIARLRLWLSLVVDSQETDWRRVQPLPNLDFKIEVGDSLTAPDPSQLPGLFRARLAEVQSRLRDAKASFLVAHGHEKERLRRAINDLEDELREAAAGSAAGDNMPLSALDWHVAFAEVFAPRQVSAPAGAQQVTGFDVIITNPPWLRQEKINNTFGAGYKEGLCRRYPDACTKTADLAVAFFARAQQLLRPYGIGCFISTNKWLKAAYGEKLRRSLLDSKAMFTVIDFGELPVFQDAKNFPAIFIWQNRPRKDTPTLWVPVMRHSTNLAEIYDEGLKQFAKSAGTHIPASQFGPDRPRLVRPSLAAVLEKMRQAGPPLGEVVQGRIYRGVLTGYNEAFIIDRQTRDRLIEEDPKSAEIIKPLVVGDDIRRYEIHFRERYLIFARRGIRISEYPSVLKHLRHFRQQLEPRPPDWDERGRGEWPGRKPGAYKWYEIQDTVDYYEAFEQPKVVWGEIAKEPRFAVDTAGLFLPNTAYLTLSPDSFYLASVLNSAAAWTYLSSSAYALGDEAAGGRVRTIRQFVEEVPVPNPSDRARKALASLSARCHTMHRRRRRRVEAFLRQLGTSPAESSSHNPLERPWEMTLEEFQDKYAKRFKPRAQEDPVRTFLAARDETAALTEQIIAIEREIDELVASLYGIDLSDLEDAT